MFNELPFKIRKKPYKITKSSLNHYALMIQNLVGKRLNITSEAKEFSENTFRKEDINVEKRKNLI